MDYLQEGIGLRAMAQRDPLVEYQREGFDMFGAMMDAIKEESVGFLFNLEVQVEDEAPAAAPVVAGPDGAAPDGVAPDGPSESVPDLPALDLGLLAEAQQAHEAAHAAAPAEPAAHDRPHINAKGLGRGSAEQPLTYIAPELGSDAPAVRTTTDGKTPAGAGQSSTARRQQSRSNPNRGSRGNKRKR
jgi:preprotein translocase subunit SecA